MPQRIKKIHIRKTIPGCDDFGGKNSLTTVPGCLTKILELLLTYPDSRRMI